MRSLTLCPPTSSRSHLHVRLTGSHSVHSQNERRASQLSLAESGSAGAKAQGRKQAETFRGDLDVVEGVEWERQDL